MNDKIKLTKEGLEKLKIILELLKKEIEEHENTKTKLSHNSNSDKLQDNAEFEDFLRNKKFLTGQINSLQEKIANAEIIDVKDFDDDVVNINDFIDINLIFSESDQEEMTVQLVGEETNVFEDKVSINSPFGKAIYGHKIGETVNYTVNNNVIFVNLLRKVKNISKHK